MGVLCLADGGGNGPSFLSSPAGDAAESIGDVKFSGGFGWVPGGGATDGGAGASSAGPAANGNNATAASTGSAAPSGGGAGGNAGVGIGAAGGNATAPGGGGGGGGKTTSGNSSHGAGGAGRVVITPNTGSPTTYTTAGAATYVVGAGVTSVDIECWGGGSSGAFGQVTSGGGNGGGGGAYAKKTAVSVNPGQQLSVTVGAGGVSGIASPMSPGLPSLVSSGSPFTFSGSAEGWVFNAGGGTGLTSALLSTIPDSPNDPTIIDGAITVNRAGKNLSTGTPYLEWSGTWEQLGVPPGATVTAIDLDYDCQCSAYTTGASSTVGPAELRDSAGTTIRKTFSASPAAFTAVTAYATVNGTNQTGLTDPSNTSIKLRIGVKPNTGSSNSASVTIDLDYIVLGITYTGGAPVYNDSRSGTIAASGSSTEDYSNDASASGTISVSGSGVESYSHLTPYDAVIEVDSPVSHWKLGETTIATDRKGVRNLPAVNGPFTTAEGLVSGNDDSLSTVCNRALLQEFKIAGAAGVGIPFDTATYSIEVWFKQTTANTSNLVYRAFSNQRLQMTSSRFPLFGASDGAGAVKSATSPTSIALGTTTHIVGTYDGTDLILYVNGIEKARTAMTGIQAAPTSAPVLGSANAVTYADGTLDEAAWYNTALSPARVLAHYQAGIPSGDFGSGTITASGSGTEDYSHNASASGTISVSGSGVEAYSTPVVYTDSGSVTIAVSGTGTETLVYGDDATINTPGLYDATIDIDTPVSHWKLGETGQATDRKGVQNLSAVSGPVVATDGLVANNGSDVVASFFDGATPPSVGQRFAVTPAAGVGVPYDTASWSVEAWIKPRFLGLEPDVLARSGGVFIYVDSSGVINWLFSGTSQSVGTARLGVTTHLIATYNGATFRGYVNGQLAFSVAVAPPASNPTRAPVIGAAPESGPRSGTFNGIIDEVSWYNTALTSARILAHYRTGLRFEIGSSGSGAESTVYTDSRTATVSVIGIGTDSAVHSNSGIGTITATGTGVEVYVTGVYAQAVLVDNPSGYWRLADLSDSSGNGFTLTKQGTVDDVPSLLAAEPGANQAKQFFTNIGLDALTRPDTPQLHLTNDHTVEAWVTSAFLEATFDGAVQLTEHFRISSSYSGGVTRLRGLHYTTGGFWPLDSTTVIALDTPYHVVLVKEGAAQRFYINGVLESSATLVGNPNPTSNPFCIGAEAGVWNGWWGKVDEVAIYTHALSPARIQEHYVAGSGGGTSYTDSGSGTVTASGTGVESYSASDSLTGTIIASGVSSESNLGTGSASGTIAVSGTGTETYVYTDSPTGTITVSGSGTETYISVNSRIGTIAVSGTGNETYVYTDAASGTVTVSGSGTESYTTPIIYTDARSGTIIASGTGIDSRVYTDSSTGTVVSTGTFTDNAVYADTSTGTVAFTGIRTDNAVYADTSTGTVVATGTGIESYSALIIYTDASSGTITVSGTGTESGVYTDTVTGTVVYTGTCIENAVYADTSTGTVVATGTRTDSDVYDDSTTGTVSATGTGTDVFAHSNTSIGTSLISGTGVESASYTDSAIGTTILSGTSSETSDQSSSSVGTVVVSGTGIDSRVYTDAMSGTLLISGTGVDSSEVLIGYVDASTGQINATGTSVESQSHTSTATGSLLTDGTSVESQSHTSSATGSILASGTRVESRSYTDTATGFVLVDGTGSETNVIELVYTDLSEGVVTSTGTGVESVSYSRTATGTVEVTGTSVDSAFYDNTATGTITLFGSSVVSDSYTDTAFGIIVLTGTGREFYNETAPVQPVPVTKIIALNRINVSVWNQTPIRSVVTSRAPIVVHIALQHNVRVAVTKRNQMKVLATSL